jgi:hypothetical protein
MKRLTLHRLASLLHRFIASSLHRFIASSLHPCQHYINPCRNCQINGAKLSKTSVKAKTTKFFDFAMEITEITIFLEIALGIHRFIASKREYVFR